MLEVYLFLAAFAAQILGMSVLYPIRLTQIIRTGLAKIPAERLAELYPGVDVGQAHERFLARYRAANAVVVVLGLLLLGWLISYMQRPNWVEGPVGGRVTGYFVLQYFPIILLAWFYKRFNKVHRRLLPEPKRKAVLQPRAFFDFISPFTVFLAILAYFQFVAFMFYVARHPVPGLSGPIALIGIVTLAYVLFGLSVYRVLYGRKIDPLQTQADRMRTISVTVNLYAWVCILIPVLLSLAVVPTVLERETWGPLAGTSYFLIFTLLWLRGLSAPPRRPEAGGLGTNPVR